MPGLIIGGKEVEVPGVPIRNFKDEPKLALRVGKAPSDGETPRDFPVSLIVLHTTKGIPGGSNKTPQTLRPGLGPDTKAEDRTANYWSTDPQNSGAHIVIDSDGSTACLADLKTVCAYHAGDRGVNHRSVGIEIYQEADADLYAGQLDVVVKIVDVLTIEFGIQRQIPHKYMGKPAPRLDMGGKDCVGVIGHRDCSNQRGQGDPGDFIFDALEKAGYERVNYHSGTDLYTWKNRQKDLVAKTGLELLVDGVPGVATRAALTQLGYRHGLWAFPPVKVPANVNPIEAMLNGFMALWSLSAGSRGAALDTIRAWLAKQ
jgi:hypothetical protein